MTPEERCDDIAKTLYMGNIPDIWTIMARAVVLAHLKAAEAEAFARGVRVGASGLT